MRRTKNVVLEKSLQSGYWREADALAVLSSWRESGLSLHAFAQRHGLSVSRLDRWKSRLRAGGQPVQFHRVEVVQPAVLPQAGAGGRVDVVLRGGRRVRVRRGFDASLLEAVARAVESWPC
jgi:hypothetical protein